MTSVHAARAAAVLADTARVLDCLPRAIVVEDLDGVVLAWNAQAERVYGWTAEEAIGRRVRDLLVPPGGDATYKDVVDRAHRGESWVEEFTAQRKGGGTVDVLAFIAPLVDDDGAAVGMVGAADDLSELKALREHADVLAERLLLALGAGQLGTWQWDRRTGATTWDETMERIFGFAPGTFDGTYDAWLGAIHPDDRGAVEATVGRAVEERTSYEVEHRVVWPDGTIRWVQGRGSIILDAEGEVVGTIGCASDVTAHKQNELETERRAAEAESAAAREREQRERLELLASVNEAALAATDHVGLMQAIARAAVPQLGDWSTVYFLTAPGGPPHIEVAHADETKAERLRQLVQQHLYRPDAPTGVPAVIRTGRAEILHVDEGFTQRVVAEASTTEAEVRAGLEELGAASVIAVPLVTKRGVVGAIQFASGSTRSYSGDDVALATAVAGRVAAALDNAWLVEQQREIATTLQRALLPVTLPEVPGLSLAVRYWAAGHVNEVGGDFYDLFDIADDRYAIVIGDVCGTGPQAAAVTAKARHTIRAAATHGQSSTQVLGWVNEAIIASHRNLFCTALYGTMARLPDDTWSVETVAGGHPLPVVVRADGTTFTLGRPGTLIGVLQDLTLHPDEVRLHPGDTLILNTDGMTDVAPPHDISDERRLQIFAEAAASARSAEEVAVHVQQALEAVLPVSQRDDDIALVVLRVED